MKIVKSNIENLPLDVIVMLMKSLVGGGFEACFNFFIAWARTQRPAVIRVFLDGFPLREFYQFANVGSALDKACFERFFVIAERLGVHDAILYKRCYEMLSGLGDINGHLTEIEVLVRHGHFISMVASFSLRNIYKKDSITRSLHSLSAIFEHREFKVGVVPTLANLESIYSACGHPLVGIEPFLGMGCCIHAAKEKVVGLNECTGVFDCFFCSIGVLANVFSRKAPTSDHVVVPNGSVLIP